MSKPARDPDRPKVPDLVPLIAELYAGHGAGCCLHVLLDDGNYDCAAFCLQYARDEGHPLCIRIAEMCCRMTATQMRKAKARYWELEHAKRGPWRGLQSGTVTITGIDRDARALTADED